VSLPTPLWPVATCALALVALLVAERRGSRPGVWLAKPLASTAFVAAAFLWGGASSTYGRLVLLALCLSWVGDVLLIPRKTVYFLAGLGSFLIAHLVFAGAFAQQAQGGVGLVIGGTAMAAFGLGVLRWLWPLLDTRMRVAVVGYVAAISAMVTLASGTVATSGPALLAGAIAFAVSDVFVARQRFVRRSFLNKASGLPLYYAGQLLLASTVR
jgi:uncharacterized membrane protein YhhN